MIGVGPMMKKTISAHGGMRVAHGRAGEAGGASQQSRAGARLAGSGAESLVPRRRQGQNSGYQGLH
ncbi:hypothetical protein CO2235_MP130094 [Cupriavidus oxalaticus]|uniref:Uncharacterized protein n=1 Tax=Cupriavidus oxalaticus TaxID=96344 RepID=A0A976BH89_9BURK|nr:hypothetical protein CO2235_MP130094 [Cupriavidus oxalaticus]